MDDLFQRRVRAAATAAWWTILIAVAFLTLVWALFLTLVSTRPGWYQALLGPAIGWEKLQDVALWAVAIFKICIWLIALVAIWLTLWGRRLRRHG